MTPKATKNSDLQSEAAAKLKTEAEKLDQETALEKENTQLKEDYEVLANQFATLSDRIAAMESMIQSQTEQGAYAGPEPTMYHDPFDADVNPHHIKKHPEGKILSWKNPNIRNSTRGWRGWVPITYDDEYGSQLSEYIDDPPAKMEGSSDQDNYVRRGTDSILCWIEEEIYMARQQKRESKALRKQLAANNNRNQVLGRGVETFGDGVQVEGTPAGGFKARKGATPLVSKHPAHRTEMFEEE
jgi:hypothetical protein